MEIKISVNQLKSNIVRTLAAMFAVFGLLGGAFVVHQQVFAAEPIIWTGAVSSSWSDPANWQAGVVPAAADSVVIDGGVNQPKLNVSAGTIVLSNLTVGGANASELTVLYGAPDTNEIHLTGNLRVAGQGVLTHASNVSAQDHRLAIKVDGNAQIDSGGRIDVSAKGYGGGYGPGGVASGSGGAHGGSNASNDAYGDPLRPVDLGSGGTGGAGGRGGAGYLRVGSTGTTTSSGSIGAVSDAGVGGSGGNGASSTFSNGNSSNPGGVGGVGSGASGGNAGMSAGGGAGAGGGGGAGGGVATLSVGGVLVVRGSIAANGEKGGVGGAGGAGGTHTGNSDYSGFGGSGGTGGSGGSGGSVSIDAASVDASGAAISSGGGAGGGGGIGGAPVARQGSPGLTGFSGAGGRVSLRSEATLDTAIAQAYTGAASATAGAGTVYLKSSNHPAGILNIRNNDMTASGTPDMGVGGVDIVVEERAALTFSTTASTPRTVTRLAVRSGAKIMNTPSEALNIQSTGPVVVEVGGVVDVSSGGWSAGFGAGAGARAVVVSTGGSGGGFGGAGGGGSSTVGGGIYGAAALPAGLGSGGGHGTSGTGAGAGGGEVSLTSDVSIVVNGSILANGQSAVGAAVSARAGGGSGGSVHLSAPSVSGTGSIGANGGNGTNLYGGGGGGGRLAVNRTNPEKPVISSLSKNRSTIAGGDEVTITGSNFATTPKVLFKTVSQGGVSHTAEATIKHASNETILVTVPPALFSGVTEVTVLNNELTGDLTVRGGAGFEPGEKGTIYPAASPGNETATTSEFQYYPKPTVTAVSPASAYNNGGDMTTIAGADFLPGATVQFGQTGAKIEAVYVSSHQLQVVVPASYQIGLVDVVVENNDGQSTATLAGFEYIQRAPSISEVSPSAGPVSGGKTVKLEGAGFYYGIEFSQITAGTNNFSCGIASSRAYCWGSNSQGQLGDGSLVDSSSPVAVATAGTAMADMNIVSISAGDDHVAALDADGQVYTWGYNGFGQLGTGSKTASSAPVAISSPLFAGKVISAISAGGYNTLALDMDGRVYAWGSNSRGQLGNGTQSEALMPVAVNVTGVLAGKTITAISSGQQHSLALDANGQVYAWGFNGNNQLGNGSTTQSALPVVIAGGAMAGKAIAAITAGSIHSVALGLDGGIYSWGYNIQGQLGDGTPTQRSTPVKVSAFGVLAGKTITAISAGYGHTLALDQDGKVYAWGANNYGQLGNGLTVQSNVPVAATGILAGRSITSIDAGHSHTTALDTRGVAYGWGYNNNGQLGISSVTNQPIPTEVTSRLSLPLKITFGGVPAVVASKGETFVTVVSPPHAAAKVAIELTSDRSESVVIPNAYEYLEAPSVTAVAPNSGYNSGGDRISITGSNFTAGAAVTVGGIAVSDVTVVSDALITATVPPSLAVGVVPIAVTNSDRQQGVLDQAFTYRQAAPTVTIVEPAVGPVVGGETVTLSGSGFYAGLQFAEISAGDTHTCGVTGTNRVYCWGLNSYAKLGDGTAVRSAIPVDITDRGGLAGKTITAISAGANHTVALDSNGKAYSWGYNVYGRLGHSGETSTSTPVAVIDSGVLSGKRLIAIASGDEHTAALDEDGKVYTWGYNNYGQLGNGSAATSQSPVLVDTNGVLSGKTITAIAISGSNTIALDSDGKVYTWGYNGNGQLGNNSTANSNVPVAVKTDGSLAGKTIRMITSGKYTTTALDSDGKAYAWGSNSLGQLGSGNNINSTTPTPVVTSGALSGKTLTDINSTQSHTIARDADGRVYSWGGGDQGQLGVGSAIRSNVPVVINPASPMNGANIVSVAAGGGHSAAIDERGQVYTWGLNTSGQLGNETLVSTNTPSSIASSVLPLSLKVGGQSTPIATTTETSLSFVALPHAAGKVAIEISSPNVDSLVMDDAYEYIAPPIVMAVSPNAGLKFGGDSVTISGSDFSSGSVVKFGNDRATITNQTATTITVISPAHAAGAVDVTVIDSLGQQSRLAGAFTYTEPAPVLTGISPSRGPVSGGQAVSISGDNFIPGRTKFSSIARGIGHSVAIDALGRINAWGGNGSGQIGDATTTSRSSPVIISGGGVYGRTIVQVAAGQRFSMALDSDGKVYAWGDNSQGQLGDGSAAIRYAPGQAIKGDLIGKKIIKIAAGTDYALAIDSDGAVYTWGGNGSGQLGDGTTQSKALPSTVNGSELSGKKIVQIAAGSSHSAAVDSEGKVYTWGNNGLGQLGDSTTVNRTAPVAITGGAIAGKVIKYIALGNLQSHAIDSNGQVYGWGYNNQGSLGDGTNTNRTTPVAIAGGAIAGKVIVDISSATGHSIAVDSNGSVYAWGANNSGQIGDGTQINRSNPVAISGGDISGKIATKIAAGQYYSSALDSNGYFYAWGSNGGFKLLPTEDAIAYGTPPLISIGGNSLVSAVGTGSAISGVTPPHAAGLVDVTLISGDGQTATLLGAYEYVAAPTITSLTPAIGSIAGGNSVQVNGTGFNEQTTARFGATTATVTYVNSTTLMVTVPASILPGEVNVSVADEFGQTTTQENAYTYQLPAPTMTSVTPTFSKMSGGGKVTITGSNFLVKSGGGSWYDVTIGDTPATDVAVLSGEKITATLPPHAPGKVDVAIGGAHSETVQLPGAVTYLPEAYAFTNDVRSVMATEPVEFTVESRDADGQPVVSGEDVVLKLSSSANTGSFTRSLADGGGGWSHDTVIIPAGSSSATFYYRDSLKGQPTLTVKDNLQTSATQQVTIASAYKLLVTGVTTPTNVGVPSSVTVQAVNYTGVAQTDFRGTVTFSSSDGAATLPGDYGFTAGDYGRRTFTNGVVFGTQGVWDLTVADGVEASISGSQNEIIVGAPAEGEVAQLRFITPAQSFALDKTSGVITIQLQDSTGAPVASGAVTTVSARSSSPTGQYSTDGGATWVAAPAAVTIPAQRSSINLLYRDTAAGEHTLEVSQFAGTDFGWSVARQSIIVGVGEPVGLKMTAQPVASIGAWVPVEVGLRDAADNRVNAPADVEMRLTANEQVRYSLDQTGADPQDTLTAALSAGQRTVTVYVQATAGAQIVLRADDARALPTGETSYLSATTTIMLGSAEPAAIVLSTLPPSVRVHSEHAITASLRDQFGNIVINDEPTDIIFTTTGIDGRYRSAAPDQWTGSLTQTIPAGAGSASVTFTQASVQDAVELRASASQLSGAATQVDVIADVYGGTVRFAPRATTITAGSDQVLRIEPLDKWGNVTRHTDDIIIGLGGTNVSRAADSQPRATWNGQPATNPIEPAAAATLVTIVAGENGVGAAYRDTLSGAPVIYAWDTDKWESYCVRTQSSTGICLESAYRNPSKAELTLTVSPDSPFRYSFVTLPQVIAVNTPSQPLVVQLRDAFDNETSPVDSSLQMSVTSQSETGEFSVQRSNWQQTNSVTFEAGVSRQTVHYRDALVSPAAGHQLTMSGEIAQATQNIRVVTGFASQAAFDLAGQTTAVAGEYIPVTLRTQTADGTEVIALADTTFSLQGGATGQFYSYSAATGNYTTISNVTIAAESSSAAIYYRATSAGSKVLRAQAPGLAAATTELAVTPNSVYKLTYTQTPTPGNARVEVTKASAGYAATTQDVYGNVVVADLAAVTDVSVASSHPTGEFSLSRTSGWGIETAPIAAGASTTDVFYYRNGTIDPQTGNLVDASALGNQTLTAKLDGLQPAQVGIVVVGLISTNVIFTTQPQTIAAGQRSQKITVQLQLTEAGVAMPAVTTSDLTLSLRSLNLANSNEFSAPYGQDVYTDQNGDEITNVTVAAGTSTASFYVTPKTAGVHRIQVVGSIFGHTGGYQRTIAALQSVTVEAAEATQLTMRSAAQTIHPAWGAAPDEVSDVIKFGLADKFGNNRSSDQDYEVSFDSTCGTGVFLDGPAGAVITKTTIQAGQNEGFVYYKDTQAHANPCTLSFSSTGVTSATQVMTVRERVHNFVIISGEQTVEAGQASNPIRVETRDRYGNTVTAERPQRVQFSVTGDNNTLAPVSTTIAVGASTTQSVFTHTVAVDQPTTYQISATDPAGHLLASTQQITVVSGAVAKLDWQDKKFNAVVGTYTPIRVMARNKNNLLTATTTDLVVQLQTNAGQNNALGQSAGEFFTGDGAGGYTRTQTITIPAGAKQATVYYRQTTTTESRTWITSGTSGYWRANIGSPSSVSAAAPGLAAGVSQATINPYTLALSTGNFSAQARAFTPMRVTISGKLPQDLVVNLSTSAGAAEAGFYSRNAASSDGEIESSRITSIIIPAGQTQSNELYYRQISQTPTYPAAAPAQLSADPVTPVWSTWSGQASASLWTGAVKAVTVSGPATLEQNQTGTYTVETRDNLGNPSSLVPYRNDKPADQQDAPACLYVRAESTGASVVSSATGYCVQPAEPGVVALTMRPGQTSAALTYSDKVVGARGFVASNTVAGDGTLRVQQSVEIIAATTTKLVFEKPNYAMVRGSVLDVTVRLTSDYDSVINTKGELTVTVRSTSPTGTFKNVSTGDWESELQVVVGEGESSIPLSYQDNQAPFGDVTLQAEASGLQSASAQVSLVTGEFSVITFVGPAQTLERQETGRFALRLVDSFGNKTAITTDLCLYVGVSSATATIKNLSSGSGCADVTLPDGAAARAVFIPGGAGEGSFELSDIAVGTYPLTVSTQPAGGGVTTSQVVTIVDGQAVQAVFDGASYQIERGGVSAPQLILRNASGAEVPALSDQYFQLSSDSSTGQFAQTTTDSWGAEKRIHIPAGQSRAALLYTDTDPQVGTYQLTARSVMSDGTPPPSALPDGRVPLFIIYGAPSQLAYVTAPRVTTATHPSEGMSVQLQNKYGYETITESDLNLQLRSSSYSGEFAATAQGQWGVTSIIVPAGRSSVDAFYRDKTVGSHTISIRDRLSVQDGEQHLGADQPHQIVRQVFDRFVVNNIASPQKAGRPSSVVVFAVDGDGYVVEWYDGTVTFSSDSTDALLPGGTYTFDPAVDKGIHTFMNAVAFTVPGVKAVTVTDTNGSSGTQFDIVVTAANTLPVRSIAVIAPEAQPAITAKGKSTERITLELRDAAGDPTTTAGLAGYPIHVSSSSSTGRFAVNPAGPWTAELDVTVGAGLSFTTTPLYYRDSAAGSHLVTAATRQAADMDNTQFVNGKLTVVIPEIAITGESTIYSQDFNGAFIKNPYLFARTQSGAIDGYVDASLQSRDLQSDALSVVDWSVTMARAGTAIDSQSFSAQTELRYRSAILQPQPGSLDYALTVDATGPHLTGAWSRTVPVSAWVAALQGATYSPAAGTVQLTLTQTQAGSAADSLKTSILIPGTSTAWTLDELIRTGKAVRQGVGAYQLTLPVENLAVGEYRIAVSLDDGIGITAQDVTMVRVDAANSPVGSGVIDGATPQAGGTMAQPDDEATTEPNSTDDGMVGGGPIVTQPPNQPAAESSQDQSFIGRVLRSPSTPVVMTGFLFGVIALIALILIYQAYKEWRRAAWLMAIIKKNQQTVADKNAFLELASHHLRTPVAIIAASIEALADNPRAGQLVQSLNVSADRLRLKIDQIVDETHRAADVAALSAKNPTIERAKIIASPIFWLPVILSIALTLLVNWAITAFGGQVLSSTLLAGQLLISILGFILLYTAARLLYMRRERRRVLDASHRSVEVLNQAKIKFASRVNQDLTDDIMHVGSYAQEAELLRDDAASQTLSEGARRLKQLASRFAVLASLYAVAPAPRDLRVETVVDDAIREVGRDIDLSGLQVDDRTTRISLRQDKRLMTKLFETVIASMVPSGQAAQLVVDGTQNEDGGVSLRITGAAHDDAPAENLFSVYSRADQESAGTMRASDDQSMQRLDLYLDRLIVDSLGGSIDAKRLGGRMSVFLTLPSLG